MKLKLINVLISCLEISADHLISFFIQYVNRFYPQQFNFLCIAGEEVKNIKHKNVQVINDIITLGNIGIIENLHNTTTYLKFIHWFKNYLKKNKQIDFFLAVDGQGINIPLGKIARKKNIKTLYLFPPPVFTFGKNILKKMHYFDIIFCPFYKDYQIYKKKFKAIFTSHPYWYIYKKNLFRKPNPKTKIYKLFNSKKKVISLFPGSRYLEIKKNMPKFLTTIKKMKDKDFQFIISLAHQSYLNFIRGQLKLHQLNIPIFHSYSDYIIKKSFFILAASGTTTLKASFLGIPHVITYQIQSFSYFLYRILVKFKILIYTPFIGTINVYQEKLITPELINKQFNHTEIISYFNKITNKKNYISKKNELFKVSQKFGGKNAFKIIAETIIKWPT